MTTKATLPANFDSLAYIHSVSPVIGLNLDPETHIEVSKLLNVAHNMAAVVYSVPLDENEFDMASVYTPGRKND